MRKMNELDSDRNKQAPMPESRQCWVIF
jgi:hypothetical protein